MRRADDEPVRSLGRPGVEALLPESGHQLVEEIAASAHNGPHWRLLGKTVLILFTPFWEYMVKMTCRTTWFVRRSFRNSTRDRQVWSPRAGYVASGSAAMVRMARSATSRQF
ncbi:hypothetical protein [Actinomycetospora sp. NBRC 106378]|uniref:hypothetical protein n=1 Tax=Actinomycetospora sp. NBRC 106378 TaxID=3032208 RepID=UPI002553D773|nr:hypothetical protein [Actinomycetospora sp. NBRC 106378]